MKRSVPSRTVIKESVNAGCGEGGGGGVSKLVGGLESDAVEAEKRQTLSLRNERVKGSRPFLKVAPCARGRVIGGQTLFIYLFMNRSL